MKKWRTGSGCLSGVFRESSTTDPLVDSINHYRSVLHQLDEKFPSPFILQDVLEADATFRGLPLPEGEEGSGEATSGDEQGELLIL